MHIPEVLKPPFRYQFIDSVGLGGILKGKLLENEGEESYSKGENISRHEFICILRVVFGLMYLRGHVASPGAFVGVGGCVMREQSLCKAKVCYFGGDCVF